MPGATSVWAQYTIVTEDRDGLAKACREAGVPTAIHYASALNRCRHTGRCPRRRRGFLRRNGWPSA